MDSEAERYNPTAASSAASKSRKRTASACIQCQQRKRRCDGAKPVCGLCVRRNSHCIYKARKRRGPGKSKEHIRLLEERLRRVESSLQDPAAHMLEYELDNTRDEIHNGGNVPTDSQNDLTSAKAHNDLRRTTPVESVDVHPSGRRFTSKLTKFSDDISAIYQQMQTAMDTSHFCRRVFIPFPTSPHVVHLMESLVETIQLHGVLFSKESFLYLLNQQFNASPAYRADDGSQWAIVNSFLASSMRVKIVNESLESMSPVVWSYFKNAFATFPELLIQSTDVSACEALLAMAIFMLGTADARTLSQLTVVAARLVKLLGLHRKDHYSAIPPIVAERHRRAFWMVYILNVDVMHKCALPSPFENEKITVDLPKDKSSRILRNSAEIAVIQSRIDGILHSNRFLPYNSAEHFDAISTAYQELQTWKSALPEQIQPQSEACEELLDMSLVVLHFRYYSSAAKAHMAMTGLVDPANSAAARDPPPRESQRWLSGKLARGLCAGSARRIITLLPHLKGQPLVYIWELLCYPLSAVLILTSTVLEDPAGCSAKSDIRSIGEFVSLLEQLQKDGCDVQRLLDGCIRIQKIAIGAVEAHEASREPLASACISAATVEWAQVEPIRLKLSRVTDWLHLAQGLLSNIPVLTAEAEDILSDFLDVKSISDDYGAFVPKVLKSHNNGFSFGP